MNTVDTLLCVHVLCLINEGLVDNRPALGLGKPASDLIDMELYVGTDSSMEGGRRDPP